MEDKKFSKDIGKSAKELMEARKEKGTILALCLCPWCRRMATGAAYCWRGLSREISGQENRRKRRDIMDNYLYHNRHCSRLL